MFDTASYVSLRTYRRSGTSVDTPVWIAPAGDKLYVFSAGDAGKVKRLRLGHTAALATCDARGNLKGEWHNVRAELTSDDEEIQLALAAFRNKYGWQMRLADWGAKFSGRFNKRAYIRISKL